MTTAKRENMSTDWERSLPKPRRTQSLLAGILIPAILMIVVLYLVVSLTNRDPMWFNATFNERPANIRIYHYGEVIDLRAGQPGFDDLVAAINSEIPIHAGYYESLGQTGATLEAYQQRGYAIELAYAKPVQIHTRNFFPAAPNLFIAIDGSYNYLKYAMLFRGQNNQWIPGALALKSVDLIRAAADTAIAKN